MEKNLSKNTITGLTLCNLLKNWVKKEHLKMINVYTGLQALYWKD